jgi:hypothetical protein
MCITHLHVHLDQDLVRVPIRRPNGLWRVNLLQHVNGGPLLRGGPARLAHGLHQAAGQLTVGLGEQEQDTEHVHHRCASRFHGVQPLFDAALLSLAVF